MQEDRIDSVISDWSKERPDLSTEALAIVLRIQTLAKLMAENLTARFKELDLEWWEYDVLSVLRRMGNPYRMSASEIAGSTRLSAGAMTNRIDGLAARGFVERVADPADRRRVMVQLSEAGRHIVDLATTSRFEMARSAVDVLDTAEQVQLSDLLRKLVVSNVTSIERGGRRRQG